MAFHGSSLPDRDDARGSTIPWDLIPVDRRPPVPSTRLRPDFAWIDVEASSLNVGSYPIEVGWAFDDLSGGSVLIAPPAEWTDWSRGSEEMHGIPRRLLAEKGVSPAEAAAVLNRALAGTTAFSDTAGNSNLDLAWLRRLYVAAGTAVAFRFEHVNQALGRHLGLDTKAKVDAVVGRLAEAEHLAERHYRHSHHAGEDAVNMAASFRMTVDDGFMAEARLHASRVAARRP